MMTSEMVSKYILTISLDHGQNAQWLSG